MSGSTPSIEPDRIEVAAGIITDRHGRVLIAQRNYPDRYFGKWEFPGGKVESGETVQQALQRELEEELGIRVLDSEALIIVRHDYPDRRVTLNVCRITAYSGTPHGLENQALQWCAPSELSDVDLLAGNRPIVRALELPAEYIITDAGRYGSDRILARLGQILKPGVFIQVREKTMGESELRQFTQQVAQQCRAHGARVLINGTPELALQLAVDGVHLTSERLAVCRHRPLPESLWVAASCHDEQELVMAQRIRADFVVLGPVLATASHPGATPLGWQRFRELCADAHMPVYALGGLRPAHAARARQAGGHGIAMVSAVWGASASR